MKTDSFSEQYRHPNWQKKRLEVLEVYGYQCAHCEDKETELQVHHIEYEKNKKVWEYHLDNFVVLCKPCHKAVTDIITDTKRRMSDVLYVAALQYLSNIWPHKNHDYMCFIIGMLSEHKELIEPLYFNLLSTHQNATKISQTRNNQ